MTFKDIGDGTRDLFYRADRLRWVSRVLEAAPQDATFIVEIRVMDSVLRTPSINLNRDDMEGLVDLLDGPVDPEKERDLAFTPVTCKGCTGTCCTGEGSDPCTCD